MKQTARLIYQTALMESGFFLSNPKDFATQIYASVSNSLNISPDATVEEEDDAEEAESDSSPKEKESTDAEADSSDLKDEL